jgi:hypothetical protein
MICPYGGTCIDPGSPSDCYANDRCVNFSSAKERAEFDRLPDRYYFKFKEGGVVKFKNENQLKFLLTDLGEEEKKAGEWGKL